MTNFQELAPLYQRTLSRVIHRARNRKASGDRRGAAQDLERAAEIATRLASHVPDRKSRLARLQSAQGFRLEAARLVVPAQEPSGRDRTGTATAIQPEEDVAELLTTSRVGWDDIAGLDEAGGALRMAVAILLGRPPREVGFARPRSILLYGPPGNGKTLLAAAASHTLARASGGSPAFFNVRLPFVLSKYFGESSRLIAKIYTRAREMAPTIVFVDEIDALTRTRDADGNGPERRILATILSEMDGIGDKDDRSPVLSIAATNRPWDIDAAVLSRFERRILVPLPDCPARRRILRLHLPGEELTPPEIVGHVAEETKGFSGRDLQSLASGAVESMLEEANPDLVRLMEEDPGRLKERSIQVVPLRRNHFDDARERLGPQEGTESMDRYENWR